MININDPASVEAAAKELYDERAAEDSVCVWLSWDDPLAEELRDFYREEVVRCQLMKAMEPFVGQLNTRDTRDHIIAAITPFLSTDSDPAPHPIDELGMDGKPWYL